MQQGEQHGHDDRQHKAQLGVVVDQFRDQQAAEQCAEQSKAHGNQQGDFLQGTADPPQAVPCDGAGENDQIGQHAQHDGRVHI